MKHLTTYFSIIMLLNAPQLMAMQKASETPADAVKSKQKQAVQFAVQEASTSSQEDPLAGAMEFLKAQRAYYDEQDRKQELLKPFNQLTTLIDTFNEFQDNPLLNIPENKQISVSMLINMQTLLDQARANFGVQPQRVTKPTFTF